jgi:hypothetical protein
MCRYARKMKPSEARLHSNIWDRGVDGTLNRIDSYIGIDKDTNDPNLRRTLESLCTKADRCKFKLNVLVSYSTYVIFIYLLIV